MKTLRGGVATIRKIIQLRLDEVAYSTIHLILNVDQETAKREFERNINNVEVLRAAPAPAIFKGPDGAVSSFGVQEGNSAFLVRQIVPTSMTTKRETTKGRELIEEFRLKHAYARCMQLYLEGLSAVQIAELMAFKVDLIKRLLEHKSLYLKFSTRKPTFSRIVPNIENVHNAFAGKSGLNSGKELVYSNFAVESLAERRMYFRKSQLLFAPVTLVTR